MRNRLSAQLPSRCPGALQGHHLLSRFRVFGSVFERPADKSQQHAQEKPSGAGQNHDHGPLGFALVLGWCRLINDSEQLRFTNCIETGRLFLAREDIEYGINCGYIFVVLLERGLKRSS